MIFFVSGCAAMASTEMPSRLFIFPSPDGWLLLLLRDHQHMTTTLVTPGEPLVPASTHAPGPLQPTHRKAIRPKTVHGIDPAKASADHRDITIDRTRLGAIGVRGNCHATSRSA